MFPPELIEKARAALDQLRAKNLTLATAESCTGGLVSALLTEIPGSSDVFTHGFVTYANAAKTQMLGVPAALIETYGAVSEQTARAMAEGARAASGTDIAVAITGIAGPGGGSAEKPVGLVHIAIAQLGQPTRHERHQFSGDRSAVRMQAVRAGVEMIARSNQGLRP